MNHETFWTLAHDAAHWEFEIFLTVLTELVMAGIGWLFVRKHWKHHIARDKRDETYGYSATPEWTSCYYLGGEKPQKTMKNPQPRN